jgi:hypothetical protein
MTLKVVKRWFERLPPTERDLPIVILNGIAYSPRAILWEVQRGTSVGERLQLLVEAGRLGTTMQEEFALAKIRLEQILKRYPNVPIVASLSLEPRALTPQDLIREIERGTQIGMQFIQAELQHMRNVIRLARRI